MGYTLLDENGAPAKGAYTLLPDDAPKAKPFGQQVNDAVADMPRQLGLTARYGIEGIGNSLNFLSTPFRAGLNAITPKVAPTLSSLVTGQGPTDRFQPVDFKGMADAVGLPAPSTPLERVVGEATRAGFGASLPVGAARLAGTAGNAALAMRAQQVASSAAPVGKMAAMGNAVASGAAAYGPTLASNAGAQLASSMGGGLAGGYVGETGGDSTSQLLATLAGGIAAPAAMAGGQRAMQAAQKMGGAISKIGNPQQFAAKIDITLNNALRDSGLTMGDIPAGVANSLRNDVAAAYKTSDQLSPDAVRRLADYRLTGLTPTAAGLTLDPATVSQQKNLAKLGINSKDVTAQRLGQTENANNTGIISGLNTLGAGPIAESEAAGSSLSSALGSVIDRHQSNIKNLYDAARDSSGRAAPLDPNHFAQSVGDALNQKNLEAFVPGEIRSMLNKFASGEVPLNVNTAEQFKTIIGNSQRATNDGNVRTALGILRSSLDDTPLLTPKAPQFGGNQAQLPGTVPSQVGQDAIDAFTQARSANRVFMQTVENTPSMAAVHGDASARGFFEKHVMGADSKSLGATLDVLSGQPQAIQTIKQNVLTYLKDKALGGAADEVGKVSQSRLNDAIKNFGDSKLRLLFSPEEIAQIKALGRVASYEQVQPAGSAVGNANTAAAGGAMWLDRIASNPILHKIPLGRQIIADPMQNIATGMQAKSAMNPSLSLGLLSPDLPPVPHGLLYSPELFSGSSKKDK